MKHLFTIILLCTLSFKLFAQDVIIKVDKTEIKSKVLEISEDVIKYKKFEALDGPIYSIKKSTVFMIIYQNGKKEYIENSEPAAAAKANTATTASAVKVRSPYTYTPSRLSGFYQTSSSGDGLGGTISTSATVVEFTGEFKIIPDYFNLGVGPVLSFASVTIPNYTFNTKTGAATANGTTSATANSYGGMGFGSVYLPINKLTGKTHDLSIGLYPFARLGYEYLSSSDGAGSTSTASGYIFEAGLDYKFSDSFSVGVLTSKFNSIGASFAISL